MAVIPIFLELIGNSCILNDKTPYVFEVCDIR